MVNVNIILTIFIVLLLASVVISFKKEKKCHDSKITAMKEDNESKIVSMKLIVPLRIQAYERLLLYIERIQFPVLVKRVFHPAISRNDFQFSLLQNVQDEFEHNLAQRLYVSESTWQLVVLAKEEVLQNMNAVFNDNPNADVSMIAQKLASFENPMVENAVASIKQEFNSL
ncbi:MAG: hypothetical protein IKW51_03815 [Bacteroidales bacterium]|nr:hypothetical protein [Bacteroidales bacterium]